ncbi:TrmB family transcriptional regulator [Halomarina rubra]|uniref:TrmB family transcriptional regulator n=1 Tax=Halomarina rubra TaxID=2071873 RepID=A0ABD6API3_9EURY|nr:helix-turn-helix domain-containing protein [Halomarina rubra]
MPTNEHRTRAIESLEALGLREYEAKCFVALVQLSEGTAKEVSKVAGVPRSRVYDSLEKLQNRGLVDVRESNPRKYRGVSVDTAVQTLRNEFTSHLEAVGENLKELQVSPHNGDNEFWTVSGRENVSERGNELIDDAVREVVVVLPEDDHVVDISLDWIRRSLDAGVTTLVDAPTTAVEQRILSETPGAQVYTSSREDGRNLGRTLLVDDSSVLLSVIEEPLPTVQEETAVVSNGGVGTRIVSLVDDVSQSRRRSLEESPATADTANDD